MPWVPRVPCPPRPVPSGGERGAQCHQPRHPGAELSPELPRPPPPLRHRPLGTPQLLRQPPPGQPAPGGGPRDGALGTLGGAGRWSTGDIGWCWGHWMAPGATGWHWEVVGRQRALGDMKVPGWRGTGWDREGPWVTLGGGGKEDTSGRRWHWVALGARGCGQVPVLSPPNTPPLPPAGAGAGAEPGVTHPAAPGHGDKGQAGHAGQRPPCTPPHPGECPPAPCPSPWLLSPRQGTPGVPSSPVAGVTLLGVRCPCRG